jgi:hypothetical protein
MNRRMEDRIRTLCHELITEKDPKKVRDLSAQLSAALHAHVENLRLKVLSYPITDEKRVSEATLAEPAIVPKTDGAAD